MSRFFSRRFGALTPYTPGEQPRDMQYIKLNTNESPFPPSQAVAEAVQSQAGKLQLYSDPELSALRQAAAQVYGVKPTQIIATNGSDEVLNFAFMAFADEDRPLVFPDITYGFYPVFAALNRIPYTQLPLKDDLSIDPADYLGIRKTVVIANPNAPTGLCLSLADIEAIVRSNPDNVVIIDEAYVDFGAQSAIRLIDQYDNLLVTQTFSKSRSLAGARLGLGFGSEKLIADLNTLRYSTNPYNVNRMTEAAGVAALRDNDYYMANCRIIEKNRAWTSDKLKALGFQVLPSKANFLFAASDKLPGEQLYKTLKARGVLVRHFNTPRIAQYCRITIGTARQMEVLIETITQILKEHGL